jgi:glycosidase
VFPNLSNRAPCPQTERLVAIRKAFMLDPDEGGMGNITAAFAATASTTSPWDVTFVESQDYSRLLMAVRDLHVYRNALLLLFTTLGIPSVVYGAEQVRARVVNSTAVAA